MGLAVVKAPPAICFELLRLLPHLLRFASCFKCFGGPLGPEARSKIAKQAHGDDFSSRTRAAIVATEITEITMVIAAFA